MKVVTSEPRGISTEIVESILNNHKKHDNMETKFLGFPGGTGYGDHNFFVTYNKDSNVLNDFILLRKSFATSNGGKLWITTISFVHHQDLVSDDLTLDLFMRLEKDAFKNLRFCSSVFAELTISEVKDVSKTLKINAKFLKLNNPTLVNSFVVRKYFTDRYGYGNTLSKLTGSSIEEMLEAYNQERVEF